VVENRSKLWSAGRDVLAGFVVEVEEAFVVGEPLGPVGDEGLGVRVVGI
jgi:hypothetical protein